MHAGCLHPSLLALCFTSAACSDAGVTKFNTDPTAEISSHADGDTVREGYAETLRGTVGDANHGTSDLGVAWLEDGTTVGPDSAPNGDGLGMGTIKATAGSSHRSTAP